jgi:hypothetical protein
MAGEQQISGNPADATRTRDAWYDQLVYGIKMKVPDRHRICLHYNNVNKRPTI